MFIPQIWQCRFWHIPRCRKEFVIYRRKDALPQIHAKLCSSACQECNHFQYATADTGTDSLDLWYSEARGWSRMARASGPRIQSENLWPPGLLLKYIRLQSHRLNFVKPSVVCVYCLLVQICQQSRNVFSCYEVRGDRFFCLSYLSYCLKETLKAYKCHLLFWASVESTLSVLCMYILCMYVYIYMYIYIYICIMYRGAIHTHE